LPKSLSRTNKPEYDHQEVRLSGPQDIYEREREKGRVQFA